PYQIEFRNVTFSYHKKQENLTDISFALRRGETLGIIGPTGSGKTTILNLLLRFYDADAGEILLCGKPISTIPEELLHTMFGVTFQNDFLYAGSITENIDFGRALPQERIEYAARAAQAEFIAARDGGFDALLTSRGSNLSGGQKQRLLIARALAADPEILLLDDSSSALDYKTDALLRQALAREYANTTTVIVAQRISSIAQADRILVLEDGRIAGYGTHETLLQSCPSYREIYDIQMGGDVS
ncbi:MAG: ABC transporter ATP-binding protein, partial [Clostridia bacterium]|nr:ABC transporter ATP-binding protein [Clostridia bacterium]